MKAWVPGHLLVVAGAVGVLGAALDLLVFGRDLLASGAFVFYCVAAAAVAWHVARQLDLALVAMATGAVWGLMHVAPVLAVALAALPAVLLVVPGLPRALAVVATAAVSGGAAWMLAGWPAAVVAGLLGLLGAAAFPDAPTQGTVRALRNASLGFSGCALLGALALNAATGRGDAFSTMGALRWSGALFALLLLLALAFLGVITLLESTSDARRGAWNAFAATVAVGAGALVAKDPSVALSGLAVGGIAVPTLAAIGAGRFRALFRAAAWLALPVALALVQAGFRP